MKRQELIALQKLSVGIGHFIRYWGFRKVHGEIWSVVYLSKTPLSGIEIGKVLKVSKALISPAIKELEKEGLIRQTTSENSKTKRYVAESDVVKIIKGVLTRREKPMIGQIQKSYFDLSNQFEENSALDIERVQKLGAMIQMAEIGLNALIHEDLINV